MGAEIPIDLGKVIEALKAELGKAAQGGKGSGAQLGKDLEAVAAGLKAITKETREQKRAYAEDLKLITIYYNSVAKEARWAETQIVKDLIASGQAKKKEREKQARDAEASFNKIAEAERKSLYNRRGGPVFNLAGENRARLAAQNSVVMAAVETAARVKAEREKAQALRATERLLAQNQAAVLRWRNTVVGAGELVGRAFTNAGKRVGMGLVSMSTHLSSFGTKVNMSFSGLSQRIAFLGRTLPSSLAGIFRGLEGGGGIAGFSTAPIRLIGRLTSAVGAITGRSIDAALTTSLQFMQKTLSTGGAVARSVISAATGLFSYMAKLASDAFGSVLGSKGVGGLASSLSGVMKGLVSSIGKITSGAAAGASSILGGFLNLGSAAAQAFVQGVLGAAQLVAGITEALVTIAGNVLGGLIEFSADIAERFVRSVTQAITVSFAATIGGAIYLGVKSARVDQIFTETLALNPEDAARLAKPFRAVAHKVATEFGVPFEEAFSGLRRTVAQGFKDAAQATEVYVEASRLAVASGSNMATTVDAIARSLRLYGKEVGSAAAISDKLFVAAAMGSAEVEDFAGNLGKVLGQAKGLNVPFNQLIATLSVATNVLRPEQAFIGLSTALSDLISPTVKSAEVLRRLGVEYDLTDLNLVKFLKDLKEQGATVADVEAIFEQRSGRFIFSLLPRLDDLDKAFLKIEKSQGKTVTKAAEMVAKSPAKAWERLQTAVRKAGDEFFQMARGDILKFIEALISAVERLHKAALALVESGAFSRLVEFAKKGIQGIQSKFSGFGAAINAGLTKGPGAGLSALQETPIYNDVRNGLLRVEASLLRVGASVIDSLSSWFTKLITEIVRIAEDAKTVLFEAGKAFIVPIFEAVSTLVKFQFQLAGGKLGMALGSKFGAAGQVVGGVAGALTGGMTADEFGKLLTDAFDRGLDRFNATVRGFVVAKPQPPNLRALPPEPQLSGRRLPDQAALEAWAMSVEKILEEQDKDFKEYHEKLKAHRLLEWKQAGEEMRVQGGGESVDSTHIQKLKEGLRTFATDVGEFSKKLRASADTAEKSIRVVVGSVVDTAKATGVIVGGVAALFMGSQTGRGNVGGKVTGAKPVDQGTLRAKLGMEQSKVQVVVDAMTQELKPIRKELELTSKSIHLQGNILADFRDRLLTAIDKFQARVTAIMSAGQEAVSSIRQLLAPKEVRLPQAVRKALRQHRRVEEKKEQAIFNQAITGGGFFGAPTTKTDLPSIFAAQAAVGKQRMEYNQSLDAMQMEASKRIVHNEVLEQIFYEEAAVRAQMLRDLSALHESILSGGISGNQLDEMRRLGVEWATAQMDRGAMARLVTEREEDVMTPGGGPKNEMARRALQTISDEVGRPSVPKVEELWSGGTETRGSLDEVQKVMGDKALSVENIDEVLRQMDEQTNAIQEKILKIDEFFNAQDKHVEGIEGFLESVSKTVGIETKVVESAVNRIKALEKELASYQATVKQLESKLTGSR